MRGVHTYCVYIMFMIKSFADKKTEKIFNQIVSRKLPYDIQKVALRKLIMIDNAECWMIYAFHQQIVRKLLAGTEKGSTAYA